MIWLVYAALEALIVLAGFASIRFGPTKDGQGALVGVFMIWMGCTALLLCSLPFTLLIDHFFLIRVR